MLCHYAECHPTEDHYTECHFAECCHAECHGTAEICQPIYIVAKKVTTNHI
jgi:hypothetical protein